MDKWQLFMELWYEFFDEFERKYFHKECEKDE
jgi:hypothetical protein